MRIPLCITFTICGTALALMPQITEGVFASNGAWVMGERPDIADMQQIGFTHNDQIGWASVGIGISLIIVGVIGAFMKRDDPAIPATRAQP